MPAYKYECPCGLRWSSLSTIKDKAKPCPDCESLCQPQPPATVGSVFNQKVTGAGPQNTGVHSLDTNIDRVIGQHAEQGWKVIEARTNTKKDLLKQNANLERSDLSRNLDGSYRVMAPDERAAHERVKAISERAAQERAKALSTTKS